MGTTGQKVSEPLKARTFWFGLGTFLLSLWLERASWLCHLPPGVGAPRGAHRRPGRQSTQAWDWGGLSVAWNPPGGPMPTSIRVLGPWKDEARLGEQPLRPSPRPPIPAPSGPKVEVSGRPPPSHIWSSLPCEAEEAEDINGSSKGLDKYRDDRSTPGY